jgi:hypothetical protein
MPAGASNIPGAEMFDTTGLTQEDLRVLQNIVRTQGRPAARTLMHQWQTVNHIGQTPVSPTATGEDILTA